MKYLIIGVIILAVFAGILFFLFSKGFFAKKEPVKKDVVLNVWGLWEDDKLIKPALDAYKKAHPDITVKYKFQTSQNYRPRVQTQIKEGSESERPDVIMISNQWLTMFLKDGSLAPAPADVMTLDEFSKTFYPVSKDDFVKDGKIYAMPRGIDGLSMYYNEDLVKAKNLVVPQNWIEFREVALAATEYDDKGGIKVSGAALGTVGNVDHWQDIVGLLFLQQPGADIEKPNSERGGQVLKFYTDFATAQKKTWDNTMESSTQAFASGKLVFYFGPSWRAHELRQLNSQLHFKTVPMPQLTSKKVGWANYWGYAVSSKSQFSKEAWDFVKFMVSSEQQKLLYQEAAKARLFGLPYSRVDLQKEIADDPIVGSFVSQGPYYKSWYLVSNTGDKGGINEEISKYYEDAINSVLAGGDAKAALETTAKGINQVLNQSGTASPVPK